jgi:hypothetical protein
VETAENREIGSSDGDVQYGTINIVATRVLLASTDIGTSGPLLPSRARQP